MLQGQQSNLSNSVRWLQMQSSSDLVIFSTHISIFSIMPDWLDYLFKALRLHFKMNLTVVNCLTGS